MRKPTSFREHTAFFVYIGCKTGRFGYLNEYADMKFCLFHVANVVIIHSRTQMTSIIYGRNKSVIKINLQTVHSYYFFCFFFLFRYARNLGYAFGLLLTRHFSSLTAFSIVSLKFSDLSNLRLYL